MSRSRRRTRCDCGPGEKPEQKASLPLTQKAALLIYPGSGPLLTSFPGKIIAAEMGACPNEANAKTLVPPALTTCLDVQQTLINLGIPVAADPVRDITPRKCSSTIIDCSTAQR
jgi:hypothetical protein